MDRYEFTEAMYIEGKRYLAGTIISPGDIPQGNFESLLQTRRLKKLPPEEIKKPEPTKAPEVKKTEPKK